MSLIISLLVVALVLFLLEIIVPGTVLALLAVGCLVAATIIAYNEMGVQVALIIFVCSCVASLLFFILELKMLKSGPLRKFISSESSITAVSVDTQTDDSIIGQSGTALTTMAPSGRVQIGDRTFEASCQGGYIQKNTAITVIRIERATLIVKAS